MTGAVRENARRAARHGLRCLKPRDEPDPQEITLSRAASAGGLLQYPQLKVTSV